MSREKKHRIAPKTRTAPNHPGKIRSAHHTKPGEINDQDAIQIPITEQTST
jgi:hypothetical protein